MAQLTGPSTRFPSLEISNQGQPIAVSADGIALPAQASPSVVFKDLFAEPSGGVERQRRDLQRKQSVMDLVWDDAKSLSRALDGTDRDRLDQYLTSVREVELRTSVLKHGWTRRDLKCPKTWRPGWIGIFSSSAWENTCAPCMTSLPWHLKPMSPEWSPSIQAMKAQGLPFLKSASAVIVTPVAPQWGSGSFAGIDPQ